MPHPIKILGERNSGTNFLTRAIGASWRTELAANSPGLTKEQRSAIRIAQPDREKRSELREALLDQNHIDSLPESGGWKHAAATEDFLEKFAKEQDARVICIVRHPVAWAKSMQRNPFHSMAKPPESFEAFLSTPWVSRGRDCLATRLFESPLTLYARKFESYVWFAARWPQCRLVRYEDVLINPERTATYLETLLGPKPADFMLPEVNSRAFLGDRLGLDHYRAKARQDQMSALSETEFAIFQRHLTGTDVAEYYDILSS